MLDHAIGPDTRALFVTRRWLDTMLAVMLVAVACARAIPQWSQLNSVEHVGLLLAIILIITEVWFGAKEQFQWLCSIGLLVICATVLIAPHGSPGWVPMPNVASYATYIAITLTSRRIGLALTVVAPILVEGIWLTQPTNIVANSMALMGGWLVAGQVFASSIATWWAWNSLVDAASQSDRDFRERELRADQSLQEQERARIWRATVTRVHESLLNTIRYVLETRHLDRARLSAELATPVLPPQRARVTATQPCELLIRQVLADATAATILRIPESHPEFELSPDVFDATRDALIELAHNAVRHGSATELRTTFDVDANGKLTVHAIDNGLGLSDLATPGIGSTHVIRAAIASVGGSVTLTTTPGGGVDASITVPVSPLASTQEPRSLKPSDIAFDQGRYLFSLPLAAGATWGIIYFLIIGSLKNLDQTGGFLFWLTITCGIAGSLIALYLSSRRTQPPLIAGLCLTLLPALVPWFLRSSEYTCAAVPNVAAMINIAGFAMFAIAMWTGTIPATVGIVTWAIGASRTLQQVPAECQSTITLSIANSALILPLAAFVTFVASRSYQRASARITHMREWELIEASRAQTATDLNDQLFSAVNDATSLLVGVANGDPLDDHARKKLEVADARIRAGVQVDPSTTGGVARSIKRIVDLAASLGIPVSVRAIAASNDPRPLPTRVEDLLASAVSRTVTIRPTIHVFTDGRQDFVSLLIDEQGIESAGLAGLDRVAIEGVEIDVLEEDGDEERGLQTYSVLATRIAAI